MNFLEILEEALSLNTKNLSSKAGRMRLFAGMLSAEIKKYIKSENPRHILKNLWGAAQSIITPEKLESYKSFLKTQDDVLEFLNMVQASLGIPKAYQKNFIRMIIDKFPVAEYSSEVGTKGDPYLTRSKVTQFKQHPVNESYQPKEVLNHMVRWVFFRIKEENPSLKSGFAIAQTVLKYLGDDIRKMNKSQFSYFTKRVEQYISKYNPRYKKGDFIQHLTSRGNPEDVYATTAGPEASKLRIESVLTPTQKYTKDHPNTFGHQHSMRRTTGNDTKRQSQTMVPKVRQNMKNPYESDAANKAQTKARVLTPLEIQQMSNDYGLDFDDRRVKTMKGKTNMVLTPLPNGGWKLEHR